MTGGSFFDPYKKDREANAIRNAKERFEAAKAMRAKVASGAAHSAESVARATQTRRQKTRKPTLPKLACLSKPEGET